MKDFDVVVAAIAVLEVRMVDLYLSATSSTLFKYCMQKLKISVVHKKLSISVGQRPQKLSIAKLQAKVVNCNSPYESL